MLLEVTRVDRNVSEVSGVRWVLEEDDCAFAAQRRSRIFDLESRTDNSPVNDVSLGTEISLKEVSCVGAVPIVRSRCIAECDGAGGVQQTADLTIGVRIICVGGVNRRSEVVVSGTTDTRCADVVRIHDREGEADGIHWNRATAAKADFLAWDSDHIRNARGSTEFAPWIVLGFQIVASCLTHFRDEGTCSLHSLVLGAHLSLVPGLNGVSHIPHSLALSLLVATIDLSGLLSSPKRIGNG